MNAIKRRVPHGRRLALLLAATALVGCKTLKLDTLIGHADDPPAKVARNDKDSPALPGKYSVRVSQFLFLSDFELKKDLPLFQELSALREQVAKELQLPGANTVVHVYIFEEKDRYEKFMSAKYKDLPKRRAFFVADDPTMPGTLTVFTYWTIDRIRDDLRHELTHALLHSVLQYVPIWLDEGLAEYFEVQPERKGVNAVHLAGLRKGPGQPGLKRLEGLSEVKDMTPAEYRESWAWVHLMLHSTPQAKAALLSYLHDLKTHRDPGPLSDRLAAVFPSPEEALQTHLAEIEVADGSTSAPGPTVTTASGGGR